MADVVYRTGYGTQAYGVAAYGVDGTIKEGASVVVTASTVASAYVRARGVASTVVTSSSVVSSAEGVRQVSATASASASATASIERIHRVDSSASASASASGSVERVQQPTSSVSASSSAAVGVERIQQPNAVVSPALSITSRFVFLYEFQSAVTCTSSVGFNFIRKRNVDGDAPVVASATCSMIEKWEPPAPTPEVWTDVTPAPNGSFWQPAVASASNVWQDAA